MLRHLMVLDAVSWQVSENHSTMLIVMKQLALLASHSTETS